jgi:hypothetical protein
MGKNEREANSPSPTSNTLKKVLVVYLTKLMETKGRLSLKDINIIGPYRRVKAPITKYLM